MDRKELLMLQSLPLDIKVLKTKQRLREAIYHFGVDGVYLSFSGGKDSIVLHTILKEVEMELYGEVKIPRVFCNTGLEFPELVKMAKKIYDVELRPKMSFVQVLTHYGYPVISKQQSQYISQYRTAKSENTKKVRWEGNRWGMGKISEKWKYLVDADFKVSEKCCDVMKKQPFKKYEKETGRIPILGIMAEESLQRETNYLKDGGCNAFNNKRPQSKPIGFWREQDILEYIYINNIEIPSVYGQVKFTTNLFGNREYYTTGQKRTGCVFCMFGISHSDRGVNNIQRLQYLNPTLHDYCIRGGKYNEEGYWIPDKGLGMAHVLHVLGFDYMLSDEQLARLKKEFGEEDD